jgi:ornithine carbamoyltransferase
VIKDLLRIADLTTDDLEHLLALSAEFKADPEGRGRPLDGDTVVLYFAKPSTRTRISFEAAVAHLGGLPAMVGPQELQLGRGETIEETARVVSEYARAFVIRTFSDDDVRRFAAAASIPVINALTDKHHPCQALADLLTLRERFGHVAKLQVAYLGDGNDNVAHSLMEGCALLGANLTIASPPSLRPDPEILAWSELEADWHAAAIALTDDPREAVAGADAIYTDVWLSMGEPETLRAERVRLLSPYRVTTELMALADPHAVFMHCLPAHRGEEAAAAVIDGPRSVVFQQAENRLSTEMAVLYALVNHLLTGAGQAQPLAATLRV